MPKKKADKIPFYTTLAASGSSGIDVMYLEGYNRKGDSLGNAHRDSHYLFIIQEKGRTRLNVDFEDIEVKGNAAFYIRPGQVHYGITMKNATAWVMAIENSLVDARFKIIFDDHIIDNIPLSLNSEQNRLLLTCLQLLEEVLRTRYGQHSPVPVGHSLYSAFLGLFAAIYVGKSSADNNVGESRLITLTRQFKSLVRSNFKSIKSPGAYADLLNVSTVYLNEAVRKVTGRPLTHWIQQEIITEAKKLLYYTDNSVKEIAYELGYEDHTYFSRVFHKQSGCTATQFRSQYRE